MIQDTKFYFKTLLNLAKKYYFISQTLKATTFKRDIITLLKQLRKIMPSLMI